jgi:choline dehydrogenase-like flavoprotein
MIAAIKIMNYDLILVGTSFASSFFLKKFLEKSPSSTRVLVLERGKFLPLKERLEKARSLAFGNVNFVSSESRGPLYLNDNQDKPWIFDPSFGGSSNCWTGCTPRFMPADFSLFSTYGVGADWPISYNDLEPYYCEAEEVMSISGPEKTPYPMSKPYPLPPHKLTAMDKVLNNKYGELYISQPTARASVAGKRNQCCNSSICHLCPVGAKFTIENGFGDLYKDERVSVVYDTQVVSLDVQGGSVTGVQAKSEGKDVVFNGTTVALGANAIFNAHILLNSGDTNKHTGRNLSEQVGFYTYVHLKDLNNVGGSTIITANGFMLHDVPTRKDFAACLIESHNDTFVRADHGKWRMMGKFKFVFEDIPQEKNRVMTSDNPLVPRVVYEGHSDYVNRAYENAKKMMPELFSVLPVEDILPDQNHQASEAHILGTTRMSNDASTGVIDKHLKHHQYRNVFVLGGGAFPAISPSNPTLTLSALSLWAADNSF